MRVRINGELVNEPIKKIEIETGFSDLHAWVVIIIGILACYGWWTLWV